MDVLICCTGWKYKPQIQFYPEGIEKQLGVPYHDSNLEDFGDEPLVKKADEVNPQSFPSAARPTHPQSALWTNATRGDDNQSKGRNR